MHSNYFSNVSTYMYCRNRTKYFKKPLVDSNGCVYINKALIYISKQKKVKFAEDTQFTYKFQLGLFVSKLLF